MFVGEKNALYEKRMVDQCEKKRKSMDETCIILITLISIVKFRLVDKIESSIRAKKTKVDKYKDIIDLEANTSIDLEGVLS